MPIVLRLLVPLLHEVPSYQLLQLALSCFQGLILESYMPFDVLIGLSRRVDNYRAAGDLAN